MEEATKARIRHKKRHLHGALVGRGGQGCEFQAGQEEDPDEAGLDMKAKRFFELMRRIRNMNESLARARRGTNNNASSSTSPPWMPKFCWADFAPADAANAAQQVSLSVATGAAGYGGDPESEEAVVIDDNHNAGTAVTLDLQRPHVSGVVVAGNGDGPIEKDHSMMDAAAFDYGSTGMAGFPSPRLVDYLSGEVDGGAAGHRGGGGRHSTGAAACSLDLKLALW